jgi:hypothetical protein
LSPSTILRVPMVLSSDLMLRPLHLAPVNIASIWF